MNNFDYYLYIPKNNYNNDFLYNNLGGDMVENYNRFKAHASGNKGLYIFLFLFIVAIVVVIILWQTGVFNKSSSTTPPSSTTPSSTPPSTPPPTTPPSTPPSTTTTPPSSTTTIPPPSSTTPPSSSTTPPSSSSTTPPTTPPSTPPSTTTPPIVCKFDENIIKKKVKEYYENNGPYKENFTIEPYYINSVDNTTFDISYIYIKKDKTDSGIDKRRFTFEYIPLSCDVKINSMGGLLSGITAKDAPLDNRLFIHYKTSKCLDSNGTKLYLNNCNYDNPYQKWDTSNNKLLHKQSNKCLDSNGSSLYFNNCNKDNIYQNFIAENGSYGKIYRHKGSNKCLDSNGTDIYFNDCNSGNFYQNWI